eukprot:GFUD01022274.1.p1 GENE.GFUD01022274.1~~GFUD01022274.1.p1  ORF type:complete len:479 (-),score=161.12 GFUD01022274.1:40-1476(-)
MSSLSLEVMTVTSEDNSDDSDLEIISESILPGKPNAVSMVLTPVEKRGLLEQLGLPDTAVGNIKVVGPGGVDVSGLVGRGITAHCKVLRDGVMFRERSVQLQGSVISGLRNISVEAAGPTKNFFDPTDVMTISDDDDSEPEELVRKVNVPKKVRVRPHKVTHHLLSQHREKSKVNKSQSNTQVISEDHDLVTNESDYQITLTQTPPRNGQSDSDSLTETDSSQSVDTVELAAVVPANTSKNKPEEEFQNCLKSPISVPAQDSQNRRNSISPDCHQAADDSLSQETVSPPGADIYCPTTDPIPPTSLPPSISSLQITAVRPGQLFLSTSQLSQLLPPGTAVDPTSMCLNMAEDTIWEGWGITHISLVAAIKVLGRYGDVFDLGEELAVKQQVAELDKMGHVMEKQKDTGGLNQGQCKEEFMAMMGLCRKDEMEKIKTDINTRRELARSNTRLRSGARRKQSPAADVGRKRARGRGQKKE